MKTEAAHVEGGWVSIETLQRAVFCSHGNDSYRGGGLDTLGVREVSKICQVMQLMLTRFTLFSFDLTKKRKERGKSEGTLNRHGATHSLFTDLPPAPPCK